MPKIRNANCKDSKYTDATDVIISRGRCKRRFIIFFFLFINLFKVYNDKKYTAYKITYKIVRG